MAKFLEALDDKLIAFIEAHRLDVFRVLAPNLCGWGEA